MYIKDPLERKFYAHLCGMEHWDTRTLDEKIDQQLYQRSAISHKPEEVIKQELAEVKENNQLLPDLVFRSSYFLDMLGLPDVFTEKDLESTIITQIEDFIKELGSDFTFVARQKRITVDATDYYLDLLFFHRELRKLVAIDLKLGKFKPEHEGQMLLYLRYLNQNERKDCVLRSSLPPKTKSMGMLNAKQHLGFMFSLIVVPKTKRSCQTKSTRL